MCSLYEILYRLLPLLPLRARLIRRHFERCPRCVARYGLARPWPADPEAGADCGDLWPGVAARLEGGRGVPRPAEIRLRRPLLRGLAGAAAIALLAFLAGGFLQIQSIVRPRPLMADQGGGEFSLLLAQIGGQEASTYVFKPQGARLVIVYFRKS